MKRKLLMVSVLVSVFHFSFAQIFFQQYFDGADTSASNSILLNIDTASINIWQVGMPQKVIFNGAATVPNAIVTDTVNFYPINNTSCFSLKYVPFVPWGVMALNWMQKLDMDADYDGGIIEFSVDSGVTWQNAFNNPYVYNFYGFDPANEDTLVTGEYAFSGTDAAWKNIWLCFDLSWLSFNDSVLFRFTLKSDSINSNKEGWMIDNMILYQTGIHTVKEVLQEDYIIVYPNPANDVLYILAQKLQEYHIIEHMALLDAGGNIVDTWKNCPTKFFIETKKYASGNYFLSIKTNIKSETIPVIIDKH